MIDESKYVFRDATIKDINFLSKAIIKAKCGVSATYMGGVWPNCSSCQKRLLGVI